MTDSSGWEACRAPCPAFALTNWGSVQADATSPFLVITQYMPQPGNWGILMAVQYH